MAGVKGAILSIMQQLQSVTGLQHIRVWNNQVSDEGDAKMYDFPKPAAFVEARIPTDHMPLGGGFSQSDIVFVIHIVHEQFDAGDGTFEQNLDVYDLKAAVNAKLTNFKPTQCGWLMRAREIPDSNHNNIYHYQIEYLTGLIDTEGVPDYNYSNIPNTFIVNGQLLVHAETFDSTFDTTFK